MSNMKVIRFYPPGGPEKLKYEDEPIPTPGSGEILIRVHAVGLIWTELTWPIYQNKDGGWKSHVPGHDFAGVIAAVGPESSNNELQVGAEVYAFTSKRNHEGALAEYVLADEDQVRVKPRNLNLFEAAAVPLSALTAWQALHDHVKLQRGQKVLVTGGAGGTGVFAVPMAKAMGCNVTASGSNPKSKQILEGLGVDEFVDYEQVSLKEAVRDIDVVLDCVGDKVIDQCLEVLKPDGILVSICSWGVEHKARTAGRRGVFFIVKMDAGQLGQITSLVEDGTLKPFIDSVFPLEKTREAFEYAGTGHVHGKVIISVPE